MRNSSWKQNKKYTLTSLQRKKLHANLDRWFQTNARTFPWRDIENPFHILLAEKILQQTAAREHVVIIYQQLIRRYPDVQSLAQASVEDLQTLLSPLGLFKRSTELKQLASQIVSLYGGQVPAELNALRKLGGVGEYIARAVACFGFGQSVPIVDTNVARWLYRMFGIVGAVPRNPARNRMLLELATQLVPTHDTKRYNWAILDLCAILCIPRDPECSICPLNTICHFGRRH
jgi:A/G-specific adenine glycosylase